VKVLAGLRPGEVYALHEGDLNLEGPSPSLRVARTLAESNDERDMEATYGNTPKGNRARTVDLSPEAVAVLRSHLAWRKAEKLRRGWREMPVPLFCSTTGTYPNLSNIRRAFAAMLKLGTLPNHFTPHGLCHPYASLALQAGLDVYYMSRMLEHADIGLTVATYGSWLNPGRPGVLAVLDRAQLPAAEVRSGVLQPLCNPDTILLGARPVTARNQSVRPG
jgi:integrase